MGDLHYRPHGSNNAAQTVGEDNALPVQLRDSSGVEQATDAHPLRVCTRPNALRAGDVLYRTAVTALDKLAVAAAPTTADVATGGSLNFGTTYKVAVAAGNRWGTSTAANIASQATANDASATHVVRCTIAQVAGADSYDLFLSTDAAPLWVARVTEAQRAAGVTVTAVGTVSATSPGAGVVDIRVVGTGQASNANNLARNNAFTPAALTPINCAGYQQLIVRWKVTVDDLRTDINTPGSGVAIFGQNGASAADWHLITASTFNTLGGTNGTSSPLEGIASFIVNGHTAIVIAVAYLTGQNAAITLWYDLV